MKFIDLFAGVGGFHYGIEKAYENNIRTSEGSYARHDKSGDNGRVGGNTEQRCVYSNEWDKYANSVYRKHFGECDQTDIRKVTAESIPDHDLLCAGFPCQSFSIAGKRRGFDDTRGTLFFDIARVLKAKQPWLLLLENVKGLLSHDNGNTFKTIISTLTELGYDLQWQVLNSKDFGVPQNRERIFIVGHLRGTARPQVFPIGEVYQILDGENKSNKRQTQTELSSSLRANPAKKADDTFIKETQKLPDAMRVRKTDGNSVTLKGLGGGLGAKTGLYQMENTKIRRLTPIECERLQGFPDNWTQYGADGELMSDTQRYKMCGNAVTTNVITEIAKRL